MVQEPSQHSRTVTQAITQPVTTAQRALRFSLRVVKRFQQSNGLLLASAIAYNGLLSLIPLLAILLLVLSSFFELPWLISLLEGTLRRWLPSHSTVLAQQVGELIQHPKVFGGLGLGILVFFSSIAFSITKSALQEMFKGPGLTPENKRGAWLDMAIPYIYILVVGLLLVLLSVAKVILTQVSIKTLAWMGISMSHTASLMLYWVSFFGTALLITSLYVVMPGPGIVSFRVAIVGGLSATLLWEIARRILVWYFAKISLVGAIYGSLATVIVVLLSFEVAAVIFLVGAAVIAEVEASR